MFTIMCLPYLATQMNLTQFGYFSGAIFFGNGSMCNLVTIFGVVASLLDLFFFYLKGFNEIFFSKFIEYFTIDEREE